MIPRRIREDDAEPFLDLLVRLDSETSFMMYEPDERPMNVEEKRDDIKTLLAAGDSEILIAEDGSRLVGFVEISRGRFRRDRFTAGLVLGVRRDSSGLGVGTALLAGAEEWARERGARRLELTVMARNHAAISLYEKAGFEVEGTRKESLFVDDSFVDELFMAKLLA